MPLMFQPLARYADFQGRSRRSEYWLWALFLFIANSALTIIQFALMGGSMASVAAHSNGGSDAAAAGMLGSMLILNLVKFVFFLAMVVPSVAVAVRRMHDTNRTGWWIVMPSVVSMVAAIVYFSVDGANFLAAMKNFSGTSNSSDPTAVFKMMAAIGKPILWILVPTFLAKLVTFVFRVMDGTPGPNRFGPDPKGRGNASIF